LLEELKDLRVILGDPDVPKTEKQAKVLAFLSQDYIPIRIFRGDIDKFIAQFERATVSDETIISCFQLLIRHAGRNHAVVEVDKIVKLAYFPYLEFPDLIWEVSLAYCRCHMPEYAEKWMNSAKAKCANPHPPLELLFKLLMRQDRGKRWKDVYKKLMELPARTPQERLLSFKLLGDFFTEASYISNLHASEILRLVDSGSLRLVFFYPSTNFHY